MAASIYDYPEPLLVRYYFALEYPLPIMGGSNFTLVLDEIQHSLKDLPILNWKGMENTSYKKFYSLEVFQLPEIGMSKWIAGLHSIHQVLAFQGNEKASSVLNSNLLEEWYQNSAPKQLQTVVSMTTVVEKGKEALNSDGLPSSLIESIKVLSDFTKSLKLLRQYPLQINFETLHSAVFRTSENLQGQMIHQTLFHLPNGNDPSETVPLTNNEFMTVINGFQRFEVKDPSLRYLEYINAGKNDLNKKGLYSAACMNFGIAAEVILFAILSLSLWEDCINGSISQDEAAQILAAPLATRIKNSYHTRFGGNWKTVIKDWNDQVAHPRHRVVHTGADLSKDIAVNSLEALIRLQTFIADTLARKVSKYPRTAWLVIGEAGFRNRNLLKSAEKHKNDKVSPAEGEALQWLSSYNLWMDEIEPQIISKMNARPKKTTKNTVTIRIPNGIITVIDSIKSVFEKILPSNN